MQLSGRGTLSRLDTWKGHGRKRPCPSWPYWMSGPRFPAHGSQSSAEERIMGRL